MRTEAESGTKKSYQALPVDSEESFRPLKFSYVFISVFIYLFLIFQERVSLCIFRHHGTCSLDQVGLELTDLPVSASKCWDQRYVPPPAQVSSFYYFLLSDWA